VKRTEQRSGLSENASLFDVIRLLFSLIVSSRNSRLLAAFSLGLSIAATVAGIVQAKIAGELVNVVSNPKAYPAYGVEMLMLFVAGQAALLLASSVLTSSSSHAGSQLGRMTQAGLDAAIVGHCTSLPLEAIEASDTQRALKRARSEGAPAVQAISSLLIGLVGSIVTFVVGVIVISKSSLSAAGLLLLSSIPMLLSRIHLQKKATANRDELHKEGAYSGYYLQLMTDPYDVKETRIFSATQWIWQSWRSLQRREHQRAGRYERKELVLSAAGQAISLTALYVPYALLVIDALKGSLTVGELTASLLIASQAQGAISSLILSASTMIDMGGRASSVLKFLGSGYEFKEPLQLQKRTNEWNTLEMKGVSFRYPGSLTNSLNNIDIRLEIGKSLAIVGSNGAGKTTLIKLLTGLYSPTEGRVLINGVEIEKEDRTWANGMFSVLFQDFCRLHLRVADSISFDALRNPSQEREVHRAAERATADAFIRKLPGGYDTQLGWQIDGGRSLSGGQWQKLALARALMKRDTDVLVLDEPTASLDISAENKVIEELFSIDERKALVLVTHRMSSAMLADEIIVIHEGGILERGSHNELMEMRGQYWNMFNQQLSAFTSDRDEKSRTTHA